MTTPVKERLQSELQQAKQETQHRAERISDILKVATSMTFEEIKAGSTELQTLTRQSIAELLEELQASSKEKPSDDGTPENADPQPPHQAENSAPTWRELVNHALEIVRDRKEDWLQQLKGYWHDNVAQFDHDMAEEYGDRYRNTKSFFQQVKSWFLTTHSTNQSSPAEAQNQPIQIEVVDGDVMTTDRLPEA